MVKNSRMSWNCWGMALGLVTRCVIDALDHGQTERRRSPGCARRLPDAEERECPAGG